MYELKLDRLFVDITWIIVSPGEMLPDLGRFTKPGQMVCELGAGTGKLGIGLALHYDCLVTLFDIDPDAIIYQMRLQQAVEAIVSRRIRAMSYKADIFQLPRKPMFDMVYSEGVVEHWIDDRRQLAIDIHAKLSHNAVVIMTTNGDNPRAVAKATSKKELFVGSQKEYERPFTRLELQSAMETAGLKDVKVLEKDYFLLGAGFK